MSCKIEGTTITMTRGDTLKTLVTMALRGEPYTPSAEESVRFALKHPQLNSKRTDFKDTAPLILKQIPTDTMILELTPQDTKKLDFGTYVYDIQITFADGCVDTFITEAKLVLTPEVH